MKLGTYVSYTENTRGLHGFGEIATITKTADGDYIMVFDEDRGRRVGMYKDQAIIVAVCPGCQMPHCECDDE
jgi:hypothetical protein